ncbi:MAG: methyltransferase domain-containing protein [bacterium]|nr:methyltransferase domain-containing protein [bacterium]MDT8395065.1 methyltransferase domain-containing protein [bacterium]
MIEVLRSARDWIERCALVQPEEDRILSFIKSIGSAPGRRVLDVGCGYGSKLRKIASAGYEAVGVDVNQDAVTAVRESGLSCLTAGEFRETADLYDVILMSHIIEHFDADGLVGFMDSYLDRLKPGGHVLIATPVFSPRFFEDPDHVRPYHPGSILMIFGEGDHQVRLRGRHGLRLVDLWYRRQPWSITFARGIGTSGGFTLAGLVNLLLAVFHLATCRMAGRVTGWVGLFVKE